MLIGAPPNYLSVGQIYLYDNPLLKESVTKDHIGVFAPAPVTPNSGKIWKSRILPSSSAGCGLSFHINLDRSSMHPLPKRPGSSLTPA
jgi:hypothetical protein